MVGEELFCNSGLEKIIQKNLELELSYRIRQDILVKPFTRIFDASINPIGTIDTMKHVGHCGWI